MGVLGAMTVEGMIGEQVTSRICHASWILASYDAYENLTCSSFLFSALASSAYCFVVVVVFWRYLTIAYMPPLEDSSL